MWTLVAPLVLWVGGGSPCGVMLWEFLLRCDVFVVRPDVGPLEPLRADKEEHIPAEAE